MSKKSKQALFIILSLTLLLTAAGCDAIYKSLGGIGMDFREPYGEPDMLGDYYGAYSYHNNFPNINQQLIRIENWQQIVTDSTFTFDTYPAMDGSTVCIPMAAEFARQHFEFDDDKALSLARFSTTHAAYENLINKASLVTTLYGNTDIADLLKRAVELILVTQPSDDELQLAEEAGIELVTIPICWDAFVFITHIDNPVNSVTLKQIRGIYTGTITNWSEIGGLDQNIAAYQREPNSGSQTAMENQVMGGLTMMEPQMARFYISDMRSLVDAVSEYVNDQYSIGYTFKYYVDNLYTSEDIKILAIDGITPTDENIRSGAYPLTANYFAVYRSEDMNGTAGLFTEWILSDEGQRCIAQAGYIPMRDIGER